MSQFTPEQIDNAKQGYHFIRMSPTAEVKRYTMVGTQGSDNVVVQRHPEKDCTDGFYRTTLNEVASRLLINGYYRQEVYASEEDGDMGQEQPGESSQTIVSRLENVSNLVKHISEFLREDARDVVVDHVTDNGDTLRIHINPKQIAGVLTTQLEELLSDIVSQIKEPQ